jgi:hypothetical protein
MAQDDYRHAIELAERYSDDETLAEEAWSSQELKTFWSISISDPSAAATLAARNKRLLSLQWKAQILREIVGNPFRSVRVDPAWLTWHDTTIPRLARTIYDDRAFDRMPILADVLEEAGCTDAAILNHCRLPEEHYRGCWVVDSIIGKS